MGKLQDAATGTFFSLTLHAGGTGGLSSCSGNASEKVTVHASLLSPGVVATASHCYLVLVAPVSSVSLVIVLPNQSEVACVRHPGEIILLPPGSAVRSLAQSCGELIQFRIPRTCIRAFALRQSRTDIVSLSAPIFTSDSTLTSLSKTIRPLLHKKERWSHTVAEYFTLSLYSHLIHHHGSAEAGRERLVGGLSPKHKRIIQEAVSASLDRVITIEDIASQCGISIGHFARAFRQSFGTSFHKSLLEARIERGKELLLDTDDSLKAIACQVGYADQRTFTESFTRVVGMAPGRYRRRFTKPNSWSQLGNDFAPQIQPAEFERPRSEFRPQVQRKA